MMHGPAHIKFNFKEYGETRFRNHAQTFVGYICILFTMAFRPFPGHGLPLRRFTSHTLGDPHAVEFFWTSYQPDTGTSTWEHITVTPTYEPSIPASERLQTHAMATEQYCYYPLVLPATGVILNMLIQRLNKLNLPPCSMSQVQKVVTQFQTAVIILIIIIINIIIY